MYVLIWFGTFSGEESCTKVGKDTVQSSTLNRFVLDFREVDLFPNEEDSKGTEVRTEVGSNFFAHFHHP